MTFKTYTSRETVKARKVTDKDGETIVTGNGFIQANSGDYVVDNRKFEKVGDVNVLVSGGFDVIQKEEFERRFKGGPGRGGGEATRTRSKAASGTRKTTAGQSATQRVKAAQAGSKAASGGKG